MALLRSSVFGFLRRLTITIMIMSTSSNPTIEPEAAPATVEDADEAEIVAHVMPS